MIENPTISPNHHAGIRLKNGANEALLWYNSDNKRTFLQSPENISFRTDIYTRLYISSTGNIGINTDYPTSKLQVVGLPEYADNAAALAAGLTIGAFYRTGDLLKVVH